MAFLKSPQRICEECYSSVLTIFIDLQNSKVAEASSLEMELGRRYGSNIIERAWLAGKNCICDLILL